MFSKKDLLITQQFYPAFLRLAQSRLEKIKTFERLTRIDSVLSKRTYDVVPVVEKLYDTGNISAVMRSAESCGLVGFHVIKNPTQGHKQSRRTSSGSHRWLEVNYWRETSHCLDYLEACGYKICVTSPHAKQTYEEINFAQKVAIVLGTEKNGVSDEVMKRAYLSCRIPMLGMTESFNISVAAALMFSQAVRDRIQRLGRHGNLNEYQYQRLRSLYLMKDLG